MKVREDRPPEVCYIVYYNIKSDKPLIYGVYLNKDDAIKVASSNCSLTYMEEKFFKNI